MTVAELISRLREQPDYLAVVIGDDSHQVGYVYRAQSDYGRVVERRIEQPNVSGGIIGNPPGDISQATVEKLREYGLSIKDVAAKPCQRRKFVELERSIPALIEQLSGWLGLKNARLLWDGRVGYYGDEAEVEHTVTWEGFDDPNEIAGRLIDKYEKEQREREQYKKLHAKYGSSAEQEATDE